MTQYVIEGKIKDRPYYYNAVVYEWTDLANATRFGSATAATIEGFRISERMLNLLDQPTTKIVPV